MIATDIENPLTYPILLGEGWVKVRKNGREVGDPTVRIAANGSITFNQIAAPLISDRINIYFNPELRQIAFASSDDNDLGAFKLIVNGARAKAKTTRVRHLFTQFNISAAEVVGAYTVEVHDGLLILHLPDGTKEGNR